MAASVEPPYRDHFKHHADGERAENRKDGPEHKTVRPHRESGRQIGADHIERAVRQVDEIHDAEDQRQACRQQEQQHAELNAVEKLLDQVHHSRVNPWRKNDCRAALPSG